MTFVVAARVSIYGVTIPAAPDGQTSLLWHAMCSAPPPAVHGADLAIRSPEKTADLLSGRSGRVLRDQPTL